MLKKFVLGLVLVTFVTVCLCESDEDDDEFDMSWTWGKYAREICDRWKPETPDMPRAFCSTFQDEMEDFIDRMTYGMTRILNTSSVTEAFERSEENELYRLGGIGYVKKALARIIAMKNYTEENIRDSFHLRLTQWLLSLVADDASKVTFYPSNYDPREEEQELYQDQLNLKNMPPKPKEPKPPKKSEAKVEL